MHKVRIPRKKKKLRYIARVLRGGHFPNVPKTVRYLMYLQIEYAMKRHNDTAEGVYHRFGFVLKDHIVWWYWVRKKYLGKTGPYYNQPTQRSMEKGLFEIKQQTINKPDGSIIVTSTTKVTGRGQIYFVNKFLKQEVDMAV